MPYTAPSTVAAGQTYASAAHNVIVNDIIDHESRLLATQNTQYPYRNILINGAMQIAQRGTSVSGLTPPNANTYYTADRWATFSNSPAGTWTQAISADAPTGSGFRNSLRMTCATALTALSAGSTLFVRQELEGQTLQHIKKGTSSAQQLTLQFWVKSNKTGTYIAELVDRDNTRQVSSSYAINASDTWEQKTITFPADTTGVFDNDNAASLYLSFWMVAGTTYTSGTLNTAWNSTTDANRAVGQTNLAGVVGQYLAITGVQLEPGAVASPYEFVLYQDELRRCQRYFERITSPDADGNFGMGTMYTSTIFLGMMFFNTKRAVPVLSPWTTGAGAYEVVTNGTVYNSTASSFTYTSPTTSTSQIGVTLSVAAVQNGAGVMRNGTTVGGWIDISAEL